MKKNLFVMDANFLYYFLFSICVSGFQVKMNLYADGFHNKMLQQFLLLFIAFRYILYRCQTM